MLGFKVGRLKVVGYAGARTPDGERRWRCLCKCGRECTRSESALRQAKSKGRVSGCDACSRLVRGGRVREPRNVFKQVERVTDESYPRVRAGFSAAEEGHFLRIMAGHNAGGCDGCRRGDTKECERDAVELVVLERDSREKKTPGVPLYEQRDFSWQFRG